MTKKSKLFISVLLVIVFVFLGSFTYATLNDYYIEKSQEEMIITAVTTEVNSVLSALGETNTISLKSNSNINLNAQNDIYRNINYYAVSTPNYRINVDTNTNQVVNIFNEHCDFSSTATTTKDVAEKYITSMYSKLELPTEYELVYLEPFYDSLWEADFQKNYDGTYNQYEAVKVIFNPSVKEICALTVFNEDYAQSDIALASTFSEDELLNNAINELSIDENTIEDIKTTFVKPSLLLNSNTNDNSIHKAKVIKYTVQKEDYEITTLSYIDYYTGEFLGGGEIL